MNEGYAAVREQEQKFVSKLSGSFRLLREPCCVGGRRRKYADRVSWSAEEGVRGGSRRFLTAARPDVGKGEAGDNIHSHHLASLAALVPLYNSAQRVNKGTSAMLSDINSGGSGGGGGEDRNGTADIRLPANET